MRFRIYSLPAAIWGQVNKRLLELPWGKRKERDHFLTHITHPCSGWGRSSLRINKTRAWKRNWPQSLYLLVCSVCFSISRSLYLAFMCWYSGYRISGFFFCGGVLTLGNLGSGLYSLQTQGKEMLVRVEFTLCLAVGGGAEVSSQQNMRGRVISPGEGTRGAISSGRKGCWRDRN